MANFEVLRIKIGLKFEHNGFLSDMPSAKVLLIHAQIIRVWGSEAPRVTIPANVA